MIPLLTIFATNVWGAVPSGWSKVTSLSGIAAGDKIMIVTNDGSMYLNGSVSSGHFSATALDATHPASANAAGVIELVSTGTTNRYKLKLVSTNKYITATQAKSGGASISASSDSYGWQFESSASGEFDAKYQETGKQAYCRSYSNSSFRTYGNKSGATFQIYKYSSTPTYNVYVMSGCTGGSYSSNKGTSGSGTGAYSSCTKYSGITAGTSVTITATPSSGYQFDGWTDGGYSIIFDDSSNEITPSSTTSTTATFTMPSSDVVIWQCNFSESCANSVTINKGTQTNCTFTLGTTGSQSSCSGVSTTVTVTPNTGYGNPSVTQSGASAAPTITGSGNSWTVSYGNNTTGTSTINVSCSANNYTITLNKDLTPTTAGTASIAVTYNSNTNLTSAITKPTKTGWTFAGYFTAKNGGGTQIIDANGNVIASAGGGSTYTDASKRWKYAGNITLYAKWTCTATWSVAGATNVYSAQTVTYNSSGSKVTSVPTPDPGDYCGQVFAGWTTAAIDGTQTSAPATLFKTVGDSPNLNSTGSVTFYAVFADYDE